MKKLFSILTNGIWKENPVLVLLLGTCPTLALTTNAANGAGMGLATTFVLPGMGQEDPQKGMATHSSIIAWRIP